jgi:hypothetical protein
MRVSEEYDIWRWVDVTELLKVCLVPPFAQVFQQFDLLRRRYHYNPRINYKHA